MSENIPEAHLTRMQYKILKFVYKQPRKIKDIYNKFSIDYNEFVLLTLKLSQALVIETTGNSYSDYTASLSNEGTYLVEAYARELRHSVVTILTLTLSAITCIITLMSFLLK